MHLSSSGGWPVVKWSEPRLGLRSALIGFFVETAPAASRPNSSESLPDNADGRPFPLLSGASRNGSSDTILEQPLDRAPGYGKSSLAYLDALKLAGAKKVIDVVDGAGIGPRHEHAKQQGESLSEGSVVFMATRSFPVRTATRNSAVVWKEPLFDPHVTGSAAVAARILRLRRS